MTSHESTRLISQSIQSPPIHPGLIHPWMARIMDARPTVSPSFENPSKQYPASPDIALPPRFSDTRMIVWDFLGDLLGSFVCDEYWALLGWRNLCLHADEIERSIILNHTFPCLSHRLLHSISPQKFPVASQCSSVAGTTMTIGSPIESNPEETLMRWTQPSIIRHGSPGKINIRFGHSHHPTRVVGFPFLPLWCDRVHQTHREYIFLSPKIPQNWYVHKYVISWWKPHWKTVRKSAIFVTGKATCWLGPTLPVKSQHYLFIIFRLWSSTDYGGQCERKSAQKRSAPSTIEIRRARPCFPLPYPLPPIQHLTNQFINILKKELCWDHQQVCFLMCNMVEFIIERAGTRH